ncbi:MAG: phosphoribosyl-AMP cyclohydrolase [Gammaproteobacteria bacterium RBG_16_51_14]|nr:MAG: phosphoribosyl-AMP cyclohydrolase [Gammaproteobacteria bacterium RBG_16_51_14]
MANKEAAWLDEIQWNKEGLVPAIVQEEGTNKVLMHAWMNREALQKTVRLGQAVYWSRSRQCLWQKGEESGHTQNVTEIRIDCDRDTLLLLVTQEGGIACHTGRHSCFFQQLRENAWVCTDPVIKDPKSIYPQK